LKCAKETLVIETDSGNDTVPYSIDTNARQISLRNDSTIETFRYLLIADNLLSLAYNDSTELYLGRK